MSRFLRPIILISALAAGFFVARAASAAPRAVDCLIMDGAGALSGYGSTLTKQRPYGIYTYRHEMDPATQGLVPVSYVKAGSTIVFRAGISVRSLCGQLTPSVVITTPGGFSAGDFKVTQQVMLNGQLQMTGTFNVEAAPDLPDKLRGELTVTFTFRFPDRVVSASRQSLLEVDNQPPEPLKAGEYEIVAEGGRFALVLKDKFRFRTSRDEGSYLAGIQAYSVQGGRSYLEAECPLWQTGEDSNCARLEKGLHTFTIMDEAGNVSAATGPIRVPAVQRQAKGAK